MTNPVSEFADIVARQFNFLHSMRSIDDHYVDTPVSDYKRRENGRRGWTRFDIAHRQELEADADSRLPSVSTHHAKRRSQGRVKTAFRLLRLFDQCASARKAALIFCRSYPEFAVEEPALIHRMAKIHSEWLAFTQSADDGAALACEREWRPCYSDLLAACRAIESMGVVSVTVEIDHWPAALKCLTGQEVALAEALKASDAGLSYSEMVHISVAFDDLATEPNARTRIMRIRAAWKKHGVPYEIPVPKRGGKLTVVPIILDKNVSET